jgi:FtsP/CotA-like multicopper oxidase with cupredoxin domain
MSLMTTKRAISITRLLPVVVAVVALLLTAPAYAAAPGITGGSGAAATFNLTAQANFVSQPDGAMVYSWGYGCSAPPAGFNPPAAKMPGATCSLMQVPGPTLIVTEGQTVTVVLTNNLPPAAGNTSILFPGFQVQAFAAGNGVPGLLTNEAIPNGGTVTYTFTASSPGTRAYYSGTQGDLQVEMGLYGAIIVLPSATATNYPTCPNANLAAESANGEADYRLSANGAAYDHPASCYDREYLFQFSEMDPRVHRQAEERCNRALPSRLLHD